jgi:hypothetical protein
VDAYGRPILAPPVPPGPPRPQSPAVVWMDTQSKRLMEWFNELNEQDRFMVGSVAVLTVAMVVVAIIALNAFA